MDANTIVNFIGIVVLPMVGYGLIRISALQRELNEHKVHVAENYSKKNELTTALEKVDANFQRVFDKLDILAERRTASAIRQSEA